MMNWKFNNKIIYSFVGSEDFYPKDIVLQKYNVLINQDEFILEVKSLTFDDGGLYSCQTPNSKAVAALVVLGNDQLFLFVYDKVCISLYII